MITVSIYIFYIFTHGMYLVFQYSFSIKAVKMVDDEVQGFHDSDMDEQRCHWVRKMLYIDDVEMLLLYRWQYG